jgi:transposase-like protein
MFCHDINKQQLCVLGLVDTTTKEFRLVVAKDRNTETLKSFIKKLIPEGNNLVTDGWHGYDWVDNSYSGYTRYLHIHGHHDFGYGPESTSHIESIWAQLKSEIKTTYKMIPSQNFLYFLREAEWKIKTKNLNYEEKLQDFFEKYNLVVTVGESNLFDSEFLNNEDLNLIINSE